MKLKAPKIEIFWLTIFLAGIGSILFGIHSFILPSVKYITGIAFLLVVIAFILFIMDVIGEDS